MMKLKNIIYSTIFLLVSQTLWAQYKEYEPLQAEGNMPKDFTTLSSDKYETQKEKISKHDSHFDKKAKDDFYLKSNFQLHDLLYSGRVLYNDKVSTYIQKVANVLLKSDPTLQSKLRFYTLKSANVNAFATDQGMLFFNLGLIAQVENEAQLAMVISHEMTHYTNKHAVNRYVEKEKISRRKGMYRTVSWEDRIKKMSSYSKENEMEADLEGFKRYKKTNYSYEDARKVFDVLKYSYLPFDDLEFKKSFLETKNLILPESYVLKKVREIGSLAEENEDEDEEENHTHPSISKRIEYINKKVKKQDNTGRVSYIVGEEEFKKIQYIARHELNSIYLNNLQYEKALYNAYLLLQNDPNDIHSQKTVMKALYGISKYKNADLFEEIHGDYTEKEGSSQRVYFLTDTMGANELNIVALNYAWRLRKKLPEDKEVSLISDDLMKDLVFNHYKTLDDFEETPFEEKSIINDTINQKEEFDSLAYAKLSKYEKIKYKKKFKQISQDPDDNEYYYEYAFVNMMDDEFTETFEKFLKEHTEKENEDNLSSSELVAKRKREAKKKKRVERKGHAFGIDKIIVVDPSYTKVDERKKKGSKKFESSESAQLKLDEMIKDNAQRLDLDIVVMDDNTFKSSETKKYNDFITLNNWLSERAVHLGFEISMVNINQNQLNSIQDSYGTKYVSWLGYAGVRRKKTDAIYYVCASLIYPIFLPLSIAYAVTPEHDTFLYFVLFDIEKGEYVWVYTRQLKDRDYSSLVKGTLYDLLYQVKTKQK